MLSNKKGKGPYFTRRSIDGFHELKMWVKKMMNGIYAKLGKSLSAKRLKHSVGVSETAVALAGCYGADIEKARLAGLLHDCAREMTSNILLKIAENSGIVLNDIEKCQPVLLHAPVGAIVARRDYGIEDDGICQAISRHTVGGIEMELLDKIIFLADFIEPGRDFPGVGKLRDLAWSDLSDAVLAAYDNTILYLISNQGLIHQDALNGRNALLMQKNMQ
ncbi:MAG: putative superfamily hydrolase [Firmicutes bacterium]|nr:putative superfamily hydrolase [Bacillota bacterium]